MANKAGGRPETRAVKQAKRIALPTMDGLKTISPKKLYKLSCNPPPKNKNRARPIPMMAPITHMIAASANTKNNIVESK